MAIESNRNNSLGRSGEGVSQSTSRKWLETAQQKDQALVASILAADCLTGRSRPEAVGRNNHSADYFRQSLTDLCMQLPRHGELPKSQRRPA